MDKKIIKFSNIEIVKQKIHSRKNPISVFDVNMDRIVVSNRISFGKKSFEYFIGYENDFEKVMPLFVMLPKMSAYRKDFDETKYMSFLIKGDELLEKYN